MFAVKTVDKSHGSNTVAFVTRGSPLAQGLACCPRVNAVVCGVSSFRSYDQGIYKHTIFERVFICDTLISIYL